MARPCGYACMRSTTTAWASSTTREPVHVPHQEKHRLGNEGVGRAPRVDLFSMSGVENHSCSCGLHMNAVMCRAGSCRANAHEPDVNQQCCVFLAIEFHMILNVSTALLAAHQASRSARRM